MAPKHPDERLSRIEKRLKRIEHRLEDMDDDGGARRRSAYGEGGGRGALCDRVELPERPLEPDVSPNRAALIRHASRKWVNGTTLHYYFFEKDTAGAWLPDDWVGDPTRKQAVRDAFRNWEGFGIGLNFEEVLSPAQAELKIRFKPGRSASYVGRDAIDYGGAASDWTMAFGEDLTMADGRDAALYAIGHALGFSYDHHEGLQPAPGLLQKDVEEARRFYPPLNTTQPTLRPFEVKLLQLGPGQQADFAVQPGATRWFDFRTFGQSDTVMVLFEVENGRMSYRIGDDDGGTAQNAAFAYKLVAGHRYVLRTRLYWAADYGETAVMIW